MKRLLNKKGITLVEIIVVIAIIAIMTGILVPALSNTSSYETEARENARAFYSNVQQALVQEKLSDSLKDKLSSDEAYMLVYAVTKIPKDTTAAYSDIYVTFSNNISFKEEDLELIYKPDLENSDNLLNPNNIAAPSDDKLSEFGGTINKLLRSNEHDGCYFAVVDSKYRVVSAYYSFQAEFSDINGKTFSDDYRIDGGDVEYIVGAYPFSLLYKGETIFTDPDA